MDFLNIIFVFVLGTAIGSFLNVLIDRLPNEQSLIGRSHCDHCHRTLEAIDLIPVASFLVLGARCRRCHKKLSWQYPAIEVLTGFVFIAVFLFIGPAPVTLLAILQKIFYLVVFSSILAIFFADLKYQIIPDSLQASLFLSFFAIKFISYWPHLNLFWPDLMASIAVMLPILLLFLATKGRGMGFGDVKLAFTMGFALGILAGYLAIYIAFITGAVVGAVLIIKAKKKLKSKIAFGPFLLLGLVTMLCWGDMIIHAVKMWYRF